jgi:transposase
MPKKIKLEPHLSSEKLEERYRGARDPVLRSHYQVVWLISQGKTTAQVIEVTGYSRDWIQKLARRYNEGGPDSLGDRRHLNPGARDRALLGEEDQRELSRALEEPPEDGGMWNSRKVAQWIEKKKKKKKKKSGKKPVRTQRGWEYLRKLGRTPKVPRPHHAEAEAAEQEAFKKGSR